MCKQFQGYGLEKVILFNDHFTFSIISIQYSLYQNSKEAIILRHRTTTIKICILPQPPNIYKVMVNNTHIIYVQYICFYKAQLLYPLISC